MALVLSGTTGIQYPEGAPLGTNSGGTGLESPGESGNVLVSNGVSWISSDATSNLETQVEGVLSVENGGTGTNTLDANSVIIGDGTSPVKFIAPGTSGNVLVSDGNNWISGVATPSILTPTNVSPADLELVGSKNPTLQGSAFLSLYGKAKANGQWQVSTVSNFATTVVDEVVSGNVVTYKLTTDLEVSTTYYWRVRYQDSDGVFSEYSTPTEFSTLTEFVPTILGESFDGGFYTGVINIGGGVCYYLIVAPNSTGCISGCAWKTTRTATTGTGSCVNGYTNTYNPMTNTTHPAGNWTATRTIGGFSDWYLPSRDELNIMYTNKGSMPAGEEFENTNYWSSTESSACYSCCQNFSSGSIATQAKSNCNTLRAIRRVPV